KDADRINDINDKIHELYLAIMNNESMVAYNQAKNQMDGLMQYITEILTAAVNGEDPTTVERSSGCSGSCGSCGGCH
ncbi:MAG: YlbF family regulator, partial [Pygmaiobacter sp.]